MSNSVDGQPHVVVLGAGFAGLAAVRVLARANVRVTVIDHHPYTTFQPLLYQVATGGLNPGDVTFPLRTFVARRRQAVRYRRSSVTDVRPDQREVVCDDGLTIGYDYLLVANGLTANFFGIPGAEQFAMPVYTRSEAIKVRDTLFGGLERIAGRSKMGTAGFTIVIVGGGPTGVEMAGQVAEMRDVSMPRTYPEFDPKKVNVVLVEMTDRLLAPFDEHLRDYALAQLRKRGVDVRLNTAITQVEADRVDFKGGDSMPMDMIVWAAGIGAYERVGTWGLEQGRGGRIVVGDDLRVKGQDAIFAAGDAAVGENEPLPQLAQPAIQGGKHAGRQILNLVRNRPTTPFHYFDKGILATIGRAAAVAEFPNGWRVKGFLAWALWIAVHITFLLGGRNRVATLTTLISRYLSFRSTGPVIGDVRETPAQREPAWPND